MRKSPAMLDFFNSLHNASLFCPRIGPKSCRCAAQTPANAGFLQTFDSIRRGSRPLVLPLQKRTSFLQTEDFRQAEGTPVRCPLPHAPVPGKVALSLDISRGTGTMIPDESVHLERVSRKERGAMVDGCGRTIDYLRLYNELKDLREWSSK